MTIAQVERFYAPFFPRWNREYYFGLVDKLALPRDRRIRNMSCGQRSQVVLGLIMAQQPELLILDDYSMGLDAGYRRLFLDYMREYLAEGRRTVFLTSHVIQDMEGFVDEVIFLERGGRLLATSLKGFRKAFRCYRLPRAGQTGIPQGNGVIKNVEVPRRSPRDIQLLRPRPGGTGAGGPGMRPSRVPGMRHEPGGCLCRVHGKVLRCCGPFFTRNSSRPAGCG